MPVITIIRDHKVSTGKEFALSTSHRLSWKIIQEHECDEVQTQEVKIRRRLGSYPKLQNTTMYLPFIQGKVYALLEIPLEVTHTSFINITSPVSSAHIQTVWKGCPCCQPLISHPACCGHGCLGVSVGGRQDLMDVSLWRLHSAAEREEDLGPVIYSCCVPFCSA